MIPDSVIRSEVHYQNSTDELFHKTSQPSENLILERNKNLRNSGHKLEFGAGNPGKGGKWGRQLCSVPLITWEWAKRNGFDLDCPDKEIADKALMRFLKTVEGRACLVTEEKF